MTAWVRVGQGLRDAVITARSAIAVTAATVRRLGGQLLAWHHRRLATDPRYGVTIAAAGAAVIELLVPSLAWARLLQAALTLSIGVPVIGTAHADVDLLDDDWTS